MEEVFRPDCGKGVGEGVRFRPDCGQRLKKGVAPVERENYIQELKASHEARPEGTSGQGDSSDSLGGGQGLELGSVRRNLDMGNLRQGLSGATRARSHLSITLASPGCYVQQEVKSCQGS